MSCPFVALTVARVTDDLAPAEAARFDSHLEGCAGCRDHLEWERRLVAAALRLGSGLERFAPSRVRRSLRPGVAAAVLAIGCATWLTLPRTAPGIDPVSALEAQYLDAEALQHLLTPDDWDPGTRRQFNEAMASVESAIRASTEAMKRSPGHPAFADFCHLSHRTKVRLIQTYLHPIGE